MQLTLRMPFPAVQARIPYELVPNYRVLWVDHDRWAVCRQRIFLPMNRTAKTGTCEASRTLGKHWNNSHQVTEENMYQLPYKAITCELKMLISTLARYLCIVWIWKLFQKFMTFFWSLGSNFNCLNGTLTQTLFCFAPLVLSLCVCV